MWKAVLALAFAAPLGAETFYYGAEWRLMRAGEARLEFEAGQATLHIETSGVVGKLYRVNTDYAVQFREGFCASSSLLKSEEGKDRGETRVTYDHKPGKVELVERDLVKDKVTGSREIDAPAACMHDMVTALAMLRRMKIEPGSSVTLPMTTGKKSAQARVAALGRETVKTPLGEFKAIRYEAFLYNGVLYRRKARMFLWIGDDEKRLPLQMRLQMPFYLGTVTVKLEKVEGGPG